MNRGDVGTVNRMTGGDVWVDYAAQPNWRGKLSEVEIAPGSASGQDLAAQQAEDLTPSSVQPANIDYDGFLHWLRLGFGTISNEEAESNIRGQAPGLLLENERVEIAYRIYAGSMFLFTSHRILWITYQWGFFFTPDAIAYLTLPYSSVHAFNVQSAAVWGVYSWFQL